MEPVHEALDRVGLPIMTALRGIYLKFREEHGGEQVDAFLENANGKIFDHVDDLAKKNKTAIGSRSIKTQLVGSGVRGGIQDALKAMLKAKYP